MGCSASVTLPPSLENRPLSESLSDELTMEHRPESDTTATEVATEVNTTNRRNTAGTQVRMSNRQTNRRTNKKHSNSSDDIHINHHTKIVVISREPETQHSHTDSESIVPIFNNNDQVKTLSAKTKTPCYNSQSNSPMKNSHNHLLPGGIKSVLKTGRDHSRDPNTLSNQPIKTVTFLESVTVLSVY